MREAHADGAATHLNTAVTHADAAPSRMDAAVTRTVAAPVHPEIALRPMAPADCAAVAALIRLAFAVQPAAVDPPPSALRETELTVAAHLAAGGGAVACAGERIVGSVMWEPQDGGLYLERLTVDPAWRGRGIARALVAATEAAARRAGLARVHLGTRLVLIANRRLFASCGFVEIALHAHPGYAAPTWVEMEKHLEPPGAVL